MGKRVRTEAFKRKMGREHDVRYPFGGPLRSNIDVYFSRLVAQLVGPHTMEPWSRSPQLQDSDLVVGPGRNQYASLCWEDLSAIAPWLDEGITKKLEGAGLGH
jgi:hypothetical protein